MKNPLYLLLPLVASSNSNRSRVKTNSWSMRVNLFLLLSNKKTSKLDSKTVSKIQKFRTIFIREVNFSKCFDFRVIVLEKEKKWFSCSFEIFTNQEKVTKYSVIHRRCDAFHFIALFINLALNSSMEIKNVSLRLWMRLYLSFFR